MRFNYGLCDDELFKKIFALHGFRSLISVTVATVIDNDYTFKEIKDLDLFMFVYFDGKLQREKFQSIITFHGGEARV